MDNLEYFEDDAYWDSYSPTTDEKEVPLGKYIPNGKQHIARQIIKKSGLQTRSDSCELPIIKNMGCHSRKARKKPSNIESTGGRLHFLKVGEQTCNLGKPQGAYLQKTLKEMIKFESGAQIITTHGGLHDGLKILLRWYIVERCIYQFTKPSTSPPVLFFRLRQVPPRGINASDIRYNASTPGFCLTSGNTNQSYFFCKKQRSLYGLKQAPRAWFQRFAGLFLSQKKYARQLLERAHMVNCNPSRTPIDTDSKLGPDGVPSIRILLYTYSLGRGAPVSYLTPQICLCSLTRAPWSLVLQLYASLLHPLVGYTDADWAGCPSTRRSTSGYFVFLGDNLLSWSAKRQHTISRSSAEAEYRGVANVVAETVWIRNLLRRFTSSSFSAYIWFTVIHDSAVYMSANPVQHQCTKHIEID
ncbi:ribonuclease H-like domain-containing protein [Tanacetum coccineum]|uniref:Ribonuclease H-like domain-containing protein n=1 Tax=Tanacetum coccineum TaxID=301880 RepID=A0ABQ5IYI1_9ASTR